MELPLLVQAAAILVALFVLLILGNYIIFALAGTGLIILTWMIGRGMEKIAGSIAFNSLDSFVLASIPMYVLMGEIVVGSGLSAKLYKGTSVWTSVVPGGLIHSNILACAIFAAVSGSSAATAATIGTVAIREQVTRGYDRRLVYGTIAAGGTLGILIPPSISMIIYGAFVGQPVGQLFIAGIIPGIILTAMFAIVIALISFAKPMWVAPRAKMTRRYFLNVFKTLGDIFPMLVLIAIIMGGIYGGLMTPTEAAAVSCVVATIFAIIYRRFNYALLKAAALSTLRTSSMILMIVVGAQIMANALSMLGIPLRVTQWVATLGLSPLGVWVMVVVLYLILGCFLDGISLLLLTLPVSYPLLMSLGFDGIWLGVLVTLLVQCALITPPVGINLFVIQGIAGGSEKSLEEVTIGAMPFFMAMIAAIALFTALPWLVTWLPSMAFR